MSWAALLSDQGCCIDLSRMLNLYVAHATSHSHQRVAKYDDARALMLEF